MAAALIVSEPTRKPEPLIEAACWAHARRKFFALNDIDPQAWLADLLARLPDHPAKRIGDLLPWNWQRQDRSAKAA